MLVWSITGLINAVLLVTIAVLTMLAVAVLATLPTTRIVALPPAGIVPKAHGKATQPPWLLLTTGLSSDRAHVGRG